VRISRNLARAIGIVCRFWTATKETNEISKKYFEPSTHYLGPTADISGGVTARKDRKNVHTQQYTAQQRNAQNYLFISTHVRRPVMRYWIKRQRKIPITG